MHLIFNISRAPLQYKLQGARRSPHKCLTEPWHGWSLDAS
jgi:hypothetical protein